MAAAWRRSACRPSGFVETDTGVKLATAEKALFDFAYLSGGRSRAFTWLPEVTLPRGFRRPEAYRWVARIPSARDATRSGETERLIVEPSEPSLAPPRARSPRGRRSASS